VKVWLLVIDWSSFQALRPYIGPPSSSCQRSAALYRASGNLYFPFAHGPLDLSTQGPKLLPPGWPTCPSSTASNRCSAHCYRPADSRAACGTCVPPHCRDVILLSRSEVHGGSPKSSGVLLSSSCSAREVSILSRSPPLVSKLSRFRRVSGKRPAICCCFYLWGVIQLLTFCCFYLWGVIQLLTNWKKERMVKTIKTNSVKQKKSKKV